MSQVIPQFSEAVDQISFGAPETIAQLPSQPAELKFVNIIHSQLALKLIDPKESAMAVNYSLAMYLKPREQRSELCLPDTDANLLVSALLAQCDGAGHVTPVQFARRRRRLSDSKP